MGPRDGKETLLLVPGTPGKLPGGGGVVGGLTRDLPSCSNQRRAGL